MKKLYIENVFKVLCSVLLISIFAQLTIEVPMNKGTIPISGQSLAVLLVGFFLGKNKGVVAVILYLIIGVIDLPVFADGASGFEVLKKGSGGFLYGFVFGAWVVGFFAEKGWGEKIFKSMFIMLLGTIVIIIFGLLQLTYLYGWEKALEYGFYPFVKGAVVKIIVGGFIGWSVKKYILKRD